MNVKRGDVERDLVRRERGGREPAGQRGGRGEHADFERDLTRRGKAQRRSAAASTPGRSAATSRTVPDAARARAARSRRTSSAAMMHAREHVAHADPRTPIAGAPRCP